MPPDISEETSRLAAIVFDRGQDPDAPLRDFVDAAARRGARVAGLIQERGEGERAHRDLGVRDIASGAVFPVMLDLGLEATGCSVDPSAIAVAAQALGRAVDARPDLLIVNRFGRLESEGGGMIAEIGQAFAMGLTLIICVPERYRDAWNAFAAGLDAQLPARREAIEAWWRKVGWRGEAATR